jgi:phage recombination protein Bet
MTAELIPASPKTTALVSERLTFSNEQVGLIKRTLCAGATNDEMEMFLGQCQRTGLDPFAKQIYLVKRQNKMCIQTGIDGFRLIAERSGQYAGNDDPVFDDEDSPKKATVTVHKIINGIRCPFTASARWSQYYPGDAQGFMWKKMPHVMLGKCAEALALRKAFPQELSGLYTTEEMSQADEVPQQRINVLAAAAGEEEPEDAGIVNELLDEMRHCRTKGELRTITVKKIPAIKEKLTPGGLSKLRAVATELLTILPEAEAEARPVAVPEEDIAELLAEYEALGGIPEEWAEAQGLTVKAVKASRNKARSEYCTKLHAEIAEMRKGVTA